MAPDDVYEAAKARGRARPLRRFSADFLGMAPNHAVDTGLSRCCVGARLNLPRRPDEPGQADIQERVADRLRAVGP